MLNLLQDDRGAFMQMSEDQLLKLFSRPGDMDSGEELLKELKYKVFEYLKFLFLTLNQNLM